MCKKLKGKTMYFSLEIDNKFCFMQKCQEPKTVACKPHSPYNHSRTQPGLHSGMWSLIRYFCDKGLLSLH